MRVSGTNQPGTGGVNALPASMGCTARSALSAMIRVLQPGEIVSKQPINSAAIASHNGPVDFALSLLPLLFRIVIMFDAPHHQGRCHWRERAKQGKD